MPTSMCMCCFPTPGPFRKEKGIKDLWARCLFCKDWIRRNENSKIRGGLVILQFSVILDDEEE